MKALFSNLFSLRFLIHLALAVLLVVLTIWLTFKGLGWYTGQGEYITVPDVRGMDIDDLDAYFTERNLRYEITDSIYDVDKKRGTVVDQHPSPESEVKENRRIYLTAIAKLPETKPLPQLKDESKRQAIAILESYGWKVGQLIYKPSDECVNCVLEVQMKGKEVEPGKRIEVGKTIDLVLGRGESREITELPYLIGMNRSEAVTLLKARSLNEGAFICDDCETTEDSTMARVYKQDPTYYREGVINLGKSIDLYYTTDESMFSDTKADTNKALNDVIPPSKDD